jgi:hypothetical protein
LNLFGLDQLQLTSAVSFYWDYSLAMRLLTDATLQLIASASVLADAVARGGKVALAFDQAVGELK